MRVAILAHEKFPQRAKTAIGVLRYSDHNVTAVLDCETSGTRVADHVSGVQDAPIVAKMDEIEKSIDALLIGIAPFGGGFNESWRPDIRAALKRGCDIISGLHYFLSEDEEFSALAAENGCNLWDVRKPHNGLTVSKGIANEVDAEVILTVGTDCSVGKMTVSMELNKVAREAGLDAAVVPTGQTGIMIEDWGNPIDRVVSDFTAGAVEEMILKKGNDHDYLFVEGQGSIVHPAYSAVTCGILHGSMPDKLVLCHEAQKDAIHGYDSFSLPSIQTYVELYEGLAEPICPSQVQAGAINTYGLSENEAREAVDEYEEILGLPATDVIRYDANEILEALI